MIAMTQDQYGQARGSGYVVRGDVIPEEETGENRENRTGESRPMTRFQKVASALRGGSERDERDTAQADQTDQAAAAGANPPWVTRQDEAAMADSPISREAESKRDYWDEPDAAAEGHDEPVAVTRPDVPGSDKSPATGTATGDHAATQPDMFGTTRRPGDEPGPLPGVSPDQAGAATIADVPAGTTAGGGELRPGEAAGTLGDFSDLTYGNLIPDAETYTAQWQQIQFKFVDDPRASVTEAADIVAQVTAKLEAAIQERQRAIEERQRAITEQQRTLRGRWGEGTNADTETLRETLRMYKTFLNQLIGPRTG
jgi:hypothetical protein